PPSRRPGAPWAPSSCRLTSPAGRRGDPAPAPAGRPATLVRRPRREPDRLGQPRVALGTMRDRECFDEVVLEPRLHGGLDLLHGAGHPFDLAPRRPIE